MGQVNGVLEATVTVRTKYILQQTEVEHLIRAANGSRWNRWAPLSSREKKRNVVSGPQKHQCITPMLYTHVYTCVLPRLGEVVHQRHPHVFVAQRVVGAQQLGAVAAGGGSQGLTRHCSSGAVLIPPHQALQQVNLEVEGIGRRACEGRGTDVSQSRWLILTQTHSLTHLEWSGTGGGGRTPGKWSLGRSGKRGAPHRLLSAPSTLCRAPLRAGPGCSGDGDAGCSRCPPSSRGLWVGHPCCRWRPTWCPATPGWAAPSPPRPWCVGGSDGPALWTSDPGWSAWPFPGGSRRRRKRQPRHEDTIQRVAVGGHAPGKAPHQVPDVQPHHQLLHFRSLKKKGMDQSGCLLLLWRLYSLPCSVRLWSSSPGPRKGPEEGPFRLRCNAALGLPPWATARPPRTQWGRTWAPAHARCPRCRPSVTRELLGHLKRRTRARQCDCFPLITQCILSFIYCVCIFIHKLAFLVESILRMSPKTDVILPLVSSRRPRASLA